MAQPGLSFQMHSTSKQRLEGKGRGVLPFQDVAYVGFFLFCFCFQIEGKNLHQQRSYDSLCCAGLEPNLQYLWALAVVFFLFFPTWSHTCLRYSATYSLNPEHNPCAPIVSPLLLLFGKSLLWYLSDPEDAQVLPCLNMPKLCSSTCHPITHLLK